MVDVYLMRHAHVDYSDGVIVTGRNPLTPLGHDMARLLAERARAWDLEYLFISTMTRAMETADALRQAMPDTPYLLMDELRELSEADLEGYPGARGAADWTSWSPEQFRFATRNLYRRVALAWETIRAMAAGQALKRVGVVAHGGSINMLLRMFQGIDEADDWSCFFELDWASVSAVRYSEATARRFILWVNDARHVDPIRHLIP